MRNPTSGKALIVCAVLISCLPASGLEVDARALGFTITVPKGWTISAVVFDGFDGHIGDFQVIALEGLRHSGAKVQIAETSKFKTASNTTGLRSSADVQTKDAPLHKESFFFFEVRAGTMLLMECNGPADGNSQSAIDSIVKTLRITG